MKKALVFCHHSVSDDREGHLNDLINLKAFSFNWSTWDNHNFSLPLLKTHEVFKLDHFLCMSPSEVSISSAHDISTVSRWKLLQDRGPLRRTCIQTQRCTRSRRPGPFWGKLTWSGFVDLADDMSHSGFEAKERSQMNRLRFIILGKGLHLSAMTGASLPGQEARRAVTRRVELPMRLWRQN